MYLNLVLTGLFIETSPRTCFAESTGMISTVPPGCTGYPKPGRGF